MLIAAAVYWNSLKIPPGLYDPLGAGTMPRMICAGIVIFSTIAIIQSIYRYRAQLAKPAKPTAAVVKKAPDRPWLAVFSYVSMLGLGATLIWRVPFAISSSLFLFVAIMLVERFKPSAMLAAALVSIITGVGVTYLFGSVFSVDLP